MIVDHVSGLQGQPAGHMHELDAGGPYLPNCSGVRNHKGENLLRFALIVVVL